MARDRRAEAGEGAVADLEPGPLITLSRGALSVAISPQAGGRIAQITFEGIDQLVGHGDDRSAMIAWGCFPMAPWSGRIRHGRFEFEGRHFQLPTNLGGHAIHGVAFGLPWKVERQDDTKVDLSLALPEDGRWPFGGICRQRFEISERRLRLHLSVAAGRHAMPVCIGWHPWFRKPDRLGFTPLRVYPRDQDGIATRPPVAVVEGPWDDCFENRDPVDLVRGGQHLRLSSDCHHWVVYDEPAHATCIEPQSGPPDGFNLEPERLGPGDSIESWFQIEWI